MLTLLRNNAADTDHVFSTFDREHVCFFPLVFERNAVEPLIMDPSLLQTVPLAPKCLTHISSSIRQKAM